MNGKSLGPYYMVPKIIGHHKIPKMPKTFKHEEFSRCPIFWGQKCKKFKWNLSSTNGVACIWKNETPTWAGILSFKTSYLFFFFHNTCRRVWWKRILKLKFPWYFLQCNGPLLRHYLFYGALCHTSSNSRRGEREMCRSW